MRHIPILLAAATLFLLESYEEVPTVSGMSIMMTQALDQNGKPVGGSVGCFQDHTWYYLPKAMEVAEKGGVNLTEKVEAFKAEHPLQSVRGLQAPRTEAELVHIDWDQQSEAGRDLCDCLREIMRQP